MSMMRRKLNGRIGRWFLALLIMLSGSLQAETGPGLPEETGLYLYIGLPDLPKFDPAFREALAKDFIDGAMIVVYWNEIEPKPGVYDWTAPDRWIQRAMLLHKRLSIGVLAGLYTPKWLYAPPDGVPENDFNYNRSSTGISCIVMAQPSFWHPVYLREYGNMMAALSRHLQEMKIAGQPSGAVYQALRLIKLSGVNNTTEEIRVDTTKPDHGPCHQSDAAAIWAKAGFTPDKTVSALMTIAAETTHAFPGKLMSVDIIHRSAFPAIDNSGHILTGTVPVPDRATTEFLEAAVPLYRDRLLVQWDALWNGPAPKEVIDAGKKGARIGWQMNGFMGAWGGSGFIYPHWKIAACKTPADFQSILDNGMNMGARYIEVQMASAINPKWAPAFEAAHARMWSMTAPPGAESTAR
jgi:hypothetical protein